MSKMIQIQTKEQKAERNERLLADIIDYLTAQDVFDDVAIYTNGHKYSDKKSEEAVERKTEKGSKYYDHGEWDVTSQIEYCNPDILTMTFEGDLYDALNYDFKAEEGLNRILDGYGLYYEQGYQWSLAVYEK